MSVVPQVPASEDSIFGSKIRLGGSSIDVRATHRGSSYATIVDRRSPVALTIGMVLPKNAQIQIIALNGEPVTPQLVQTARGLEARVKVPAGTGRTLLGIQTSQHLSPSTGSGRAQSKPQPVRWSKSPRTQAM